MVNVPNDSYVVRLGQQYYPESNTIEVFIASVPDLPAHWTLIAADALQNFRAALNYVAWELAKWNLQQQGCAREPASGTEFVIATDPRNIQAYKVADLHPGHVATIKTLQPYDETYLLAQHPHALDTPGLKADLIARHPLRQLQKLSNDDKHRLLQIVALGSSYWARGPGYGPPDTFEDCTVVNSGTYTVRGAFKASAKWATYEVAPTGPDPRVNLQNGVFMPAAAFESGGLVEATLDGIGATVAEVIRRFEPVF